MKALCTNCRSSNIEYDSTQGNSFCADCGAVLEENAVVSEVTFAELSNGTSVLQGQFVAAERGRVAAPSIFGRRMGPLGSGGNGDTQPGTVSESREITLANGRRKLAAVAVALGLGEHHVDMAHRWFNLALQHQFTRGRRSNNIIASCLYIVCRLERTPHMLLDFSDILQTSVYSLGGTFLRLTQLLNLELPLVDPSFYIGRFAAKLEFAEKTQQVVNSALRIAARMKRDWIVTGRRPAGVCAASLIVAARMHGFRRTESQVVRVVHICEATLKRRLNEFASTPSSQLSMEEFEGIWLEQECDPPSFAIAKTRKTETSEVVSEPVTVSATNATATVFNAERVARKNREADADNDQVGRLDAAVMAEISRLQSNPVPEPVFDQNDNFDFLTPPPTQPQTPITLRPISTEPALPEEPENASLSDLDEDTELSEMMLNPDEIDTKTKIWTALNKDFLDAQAEIARIQAAETKIEGEVVAESNNEMIKKPLAPKEPRKKRVRTANPIAAKTGGPVAETAAEAAKQAFTAKKLSKKINYEALECLMNTNQ